KSVASIKLPSRLFIYYLTTFSTFFFLSFFFNDPATTEIYTLSLHDALPISRPEGGARGAMGALAGRLRTRPLERRDRARPLELRDRKSTRLNSSHVAISYAVFCLKKKKKKKNAKTVL